jgi:deoxyadenosine/deoxycytidine kinase
MRKLHISVVGNIASGKTTLVKNLSVRLDLVPFLEDLGTMLYVQRFIRSPKKWAFHNQLEFLITTARTQYIISQKSLRACQDTNFYQVFEVFSRTLATTGLLNPEDFALCQNLYTFLAAILPPPDLLIFLDVDIPTILQRLEKRSRSADAFLNVAFLSELDRRIHLWIQEWSLCPVVSIETTNYDFANNKAHMDCIVEKIMPYIN